MKEKKNQDQSLVFAVDKKKLNFIITQNSDSSNLLEQPF